MGSLSPDVLIDIAREAKSDPTKIPDYLTPKEKEFVKETISQLRASDKAMKVFWLQSCVIDKCKEYYQSNLRQADLHLSRAKALRDQGAMVDYAIALNQANRGIAAMTKNQYRLYGKMSQRIEDSVKSIVELMKTLDYDPRWVRGMLSRVEEHRLFGVEPESSWWKIKTSAMGETQRAMADLMFGRFDEASKTIGELGSMSTAAGRTMRDAQAGYYATAQENYRKSFEEQRLGNAALSDAKGYQAAMQLAGAWYAVAAIGDALTELGQSLM